MSLRILLADESESIYKVFEMGLQDLGVEILACQNGVELIQSVKTDPPSMVFADILIKKKNGYQIARELKDDPKTNHIPVVLMSSAFMELDQNQYKNSGAMAHLEKPFNVESLRKIVQSLSKDSHSAEKASGSGSQTSPLKGDQSSDESQDLNFNNILDFPEQTKTLSSSEQNKTNELEIEDDFLRHLEGTNALSQGDQTPFSEEEDDFLKKLGETGNDNPQAQTPSSEEEDDFLKELEETGNDNMQAKTPSSKGEDDFLKELGETGNDNPQAQTPSSEGEDDFLKEPEETNPGVHFKTMNLQQDKESELTDYQELQQRQESSNPQDNQDLDLNDFLFQPEAKPVFSLKEDNLFPHSEQEQISQTPESESPDFPSEENQTSPNQKEEQKKQKSIASPGPSPSYQETQDFETSPEIKNSIEKLIQDQIPKVVKKAVREELAAFFKKK